MEEKKIRKFGIKDKIGYALGDMGNDLTLQMLQSCLLVFYTKVLGVSGAVIGTMFMLTKFVDAFTDVGMGRIIDTHVAKNGDRFRPWIRRMALPVVVASCLVYNYFIAGWPMWAKIAYVCVVYLLYGSICYTAINIPYGAMAAVISEDPGERTSLSTFRSVGATLAGMVIGVAIPLVVYTKDEAGNSVANGPRFLLLSVVFGVLALLCYAGCYFWCVERVHIPNKAQDGGGKQSTWRSLVEVCRDRALLSIVLVSIFVFAASGAFQSLNPYLFLDWFQDTSMQSLASLVMVFAMLLCAPFATRLSKRFGKKEISIVGMALSVAAYLAIFFMRLQDAKLFLMFAFVAFLGMGIFTMVSWAMISDCIDNHFVITGERSDGTIYAMYSFIKKLAGAVTGSIGAWSLSAIGYDNLAVTQTDAVRGAIFNCDILITGVCFLGALLVLLFLYPLDKKTVEENAVKIRALTAQKED